MDETVPLTTALREVFRRPIASLLVAWNWKAALISAVLRAATFFATNHRSGGPAALRAALTETAFAIVAAGVLGAFTQRLRNAVPAAATGLIIYLGMPAALLAAQYVWHHLLGTPHLRAGLIASFVMASLGSGFNWFAMRRGAFLSGAMLSGHHHANFAADARRIPTLLFEFVTYPVRALIRRPSTNS